MGGCISQEQEPKSFEGCCMLQLVDQHTVVQVFCCICSACALADSEHVLICSQACGAAGSLLHILAGMVVLSQCWYNSSAGDGSLVLIDVARSASKARCGLALLYLVC